MPTQTIICGSMLNLPILTQSLARTLHKSNDPPDSPTDTPNPYSQQFPFATSFPVLLPSPHSLPLPPAKTLEYRKGTRDCSSTPVPPGNRHWYNNGSPESNSLGRPVSSSRRIDDWWDCPGAIPLWAKKSDRKDGGWEIEWVAGAWGWEWGVRCICRWCRRSRIVRSRKWCRRRRGTTLGIWRRRRPMILWKSCMRCEVRGLHCVELCCFVVWIAFHVVSCYSADISISELHHRIKLREQIECLNEPLQTSKELILLHKRCNLTRKRKYRSDHPAPLAGLAHGRCHHRLPRNLTVVQWPLPLVPVKHLHFL